MEIHQILEDLERRLSNILRIGIIENKGDEPANRVRVRIGELHTAPLLWLTKRAGPDTSWWKPEDGEQVLVLSPSGDLAQGVVLPSLYRDEFPAPAIDPDIHQTAYSNGDSITHNRKDGSLSIAMSGDVSITTSGNISLNGARIDLN